MADFDYDLFVIGGGSGGVRAARMAAQTGARVAVAEEFRFGGTCVIRGCVPKKLMVYASSYSEHVEDAAGFGWSVGPASHSWTMLREAKEREITRLEGLYRKNVGAAGAEAFAMRAAVVDPHIVELADGRRVSTKHILIATGGAPHIPAFPGHEHAITSNEIFDLPDRPERIVILGGGYIACEFAGIMNGLGSRVTLAYRGARVLRTFDQDLSDHVMEEMVKKGIDLRLHADIVSIEKDASALRVTLGDGQVVEADAVLAALGRKPNTQGLGLEAAGVHLRANGAVEVDDYSRSSVPSIYAVGDVTSRLELTPVAIREGMAFVDTVFRGIPTKPDHALVATAIFTQPEIGTIGLSEQAARAEGREIDIYRSRFRPMVHTLSGRDENMLMKLVVDRADDRVLGVHISGHGAGEMIQMAAVAVKMGATKADFDRTVAVHPTAAEELVTMREPVAMDVAAE
ncbi:MAG: glutathione-disulfide reductase [Pseudomonadota bacterium]